MWTENILDQNAEEDTGSKGDKISRWIKLHSEELHNLHSSDDDGTIKLSKIKNRRS
jgi:hypothetical protein